MNLLETLRAFLDARAVHAYFVGGVVRDALRARETHDLDITVQGNATLLARAFADEIGGAFFILDATFDVARVIAQTERGREIVDFARLRGESVEQDLATRDFTVNAMAADAATWNGDPAGVIDPFGGRADLQSGRLRAISDAIFVNDPVRLLRAVRFEAELGLASDEATAALVRRDAAYIERAPGERVRDELIRILAASEVLRQLRRLDEFDLLGRVLPEMNALRDVAQSPPHVYDVFTHSLHAVAAAEECERAGYMNVAQGAFGSQLRDQFAQEISGGRTQRELLRLALLLHDIGKPATQTVDANGRIRFFGHDEVGAKLVAPALRRLKFSNDEIAHVKTVVAQHLRPILLTQSGVSNRAAYRFFRDTGTAGVDIVVHAWCDQRATYGGDVPSDMDTALEATLARLLDRYYHARQVIHPRPLLTGKDVMEHLSIPPGPKIKELLEVVREAQVEGRVTTRVEALALITNVAANG